MIGCGQGAGGGVGVGGDHYSVRVMNGRVRHKSCDWWYDQMKRIEYKEEEYLKIFTASTFHRRGAHFQPCMGIFILM